MTTYTLDRVRLLVLLSAIGCCRCRLYCYTNEILNFVKLVLLRIRKISFSLQQNYKGGMKNSFIKLLKKVGRFAVILFLT